MSWQFWLLENCENVDFGYFSNLVVFRRWQCFDCLSHSSACLAADMASALPSSFIR